MESLIAYDIPVSGIKPGVHQYKFLIEKPFFEQFPSELIQDGRFDVQVDLDKRPDMLVVDFKVKGMQRTACDRCLEMINLPVEGHHQLIFKYAEDQAEDTEVIFLAKREKNLNLAGYIHESICFALPLIKTYDCENEEPRPCNEEILKYLDQEENDAHQRNPVWDQLKNLNQDPGKP